MYFFNIIATFFLKMEGCETWNLGPSYHKKLYVLFFLLLFVFFAMYYHTFEKYGTLSPPRKFKDTLAPSIISYFLTIVILVNIFWIHSRVLEACEPSQFAILRCRQKKSFTLCTTLETLCMKNIGHFLTVQTLP